MLGTTETPNLQRHGPNNSNNESTSMATIQPGLVTIGFVMLLSVGCTPSKQSSEQDDGGGHTVPEHCHVPSMNCYNRCFKQKAGETCTGCCADQLILCDKGEKYSFESCESSDARTKAH